MSLSIGQKATVETVVTKDKTAKHVGSGSLDVFATPMMVAEMERAACACLEHSLEAGSTSVGTVIDIRHTAASPLGARITTTAEVTAIEGKRIVFSVAAFDERGEIGKGTHSRFIVDIMRFMEKTNMKK